MTDAELDLAVARAMGLGYMIDGANHCIVTGKGEWNAPGGTWRRFTPTAGGADGARVLEWLTGQGHDVHLERLSGGGWQALVSATEGERACETIGEGKGMTIWHAICRAVVEMGKEEKTGV